MNNDMKKMRDDVIDFMRHLNLGVTIIGEKIFKIETDACKKFIEYKKNFHYDKQNINFEHSFGYNNNNLDLEKIKEEDTSESNS